MRHDEVVERAKAVVGRHALPDFVHGFDVRLGDIEGDPAMWITFHMTPEPTKRVTATDSRVLAIGALRRVLTPALLREFDDYYPYFRFESQPTTPAVSH